MANEKKRQINRNKWKKKTEKMVNKHKNWQINKIKMLNKKKMSGKHKIWMVNKF